MFRVLGGAGRANQGWEMPGKKGVLTSRWRRGEEDNARQGRGARAELVKWWLFQAREVRGRQGNGSPRRTSKCKITPGKMGREFELEDGQVSARQWSGRKRKGRALDESGMQRKI